MYTKGRVVEVLLRDSESDAAFRKEIRLWLAEALPRLGPPPNPRDWDARRDYEIRWQQSQYEAGYAGIDWPQEFGGRGASATEQLIFLEEAAAAGSPEAAVNFVGLMHAGPTLIAEATPEQRAF